MLLKGAHVAVWVPYSVFRIRVGLLDFIGFLVIYQDFRMPDSGSRIGVGCRDAIGLLMYYYDFRMPDSGSRIPD